MINNNQMVKCVELIQELFWAPDTKHVGYLLGIFREIINK